MKVSEVIQSVSNPGALMRPMPRWVWNGRVDHDRLLAQMDDMLEKGVRAFFMLALPSAFQPNDFGAGLEVDYLGDQHMEAVRRVVVEAAKRGMKVWLHDEGGWPSGSNLGRVAQERADLKGKVAHYNEQGQVEILERGYPVDLLNAETTRTFIRQVHERYKAVVGDHFNTTIAGIFTDEPRYGGRVGGAEIPWTPTLPEEFKKRKGYDLTLGLSILFDLRASRSLPTNKRAQVLCDFFHVVTQVWRDNYFRILGEWCKANKLLLAGHMCHEENLHGHLTNGGDFFKAMECVDWPGIDCVARQIYPTCDANYPKFASSAAHVRGKDRVLSQSFATYGWDLTFAQMKWITDYQYVRGVNALAPVGLYTDVRGPRKIGSMSDQFLTSSLWQHYREYADYVGRLSTLLTIGKPVVQVGVYYPIKSLWVGDLAEGAQDVEAKFASLSRRLLEQQIDFDYVDDDAICRGAVEKGGTLAIGDCRYRAILIPSVSIVPIETLRQLRAFAEARGTVVFLYGEPHLTCRAATQAELPEILKAMASFTVSDGSEVDVVLGTLPWTVKLGIANRDIRALRRTAEETEIIFLTNESPVQEHQLRVRLPVDGPTYLYNLETGSVAKAVVSAGTVRIAVPPSGSVALLVGQSELEAPDLSAAVPATRVETLEGPWTLTVAEEWVYRDGEVHPLEAEDRTDPDDMKDALALWGGERPDTDEGGRVVGTSIRLEKLGPWDEVLFSTFCGSVDYLITWEMKDKPRRAVLDLGTVGVVAEVLVNAQHVGKRLWPPYRFEVTDAMVNGPNTFRIAVTSTLHRLMSDETVVADLKTRGWFNSYAEQVARFTGEPAPAGLIGPVKLELWT